MNQHIKFCAESSANVVLTNHARQRMRERHINDPMLLETLRQGRITRFVAGVEVVAVVYVEYPAPSLIVVTVIDVQKD